ncbi:MAG TPA: diguanylate cyclase [Gaiellaceae bacterium]|nr:diguanylate cyclase [Gaiellaceae bacterium]
MTAEAGSPTNGHTVLLIEDSATQRALVGSLLQRLGYKVAAAADGAEGLRVLTDTRPDLILLDVVMPGLDGWETLERIRRSSGVPVIMLTARDEEVDLVRGLRAGADDYLGKPFRQDELEARIEAVLRRSGQARRDSLTGLPNRRSFDEHVDALLNRPRSLDQPVGLVLFDLDAFKQINDVHGHLAGDAVLQDVARVALREVRLNEDLFRVGGEEFAIVVIGDADDAVRVAERVRSAVAAQRRTPHAPTLSAGVASFPTDGRTKDELIHCADVALYAAKREGKNRVVRWQPELGS